MPVACSKLSHPALSRDRRIIPSRLTENTTVEDSIGAMRPKRSDSPGRGDSSPLGHRPDTTDDAGRTGERDSASRYILKGLI
jgi:hypothetical protein